MSIRIGIYDFFAYVLPGSLYLFAFSYLFDFLGFIELNLKTINLSLVHLLIYAVVAYIIGLLFDPLAIDIGIWYRLFKTKNIQLKTLEEFSKNNPNLNINFEIKSWQILLASIRRESIEEAVDIERFNVLHLMLRNISFGLLLISIIQIVKLIFYDFSLLELFISIALFIFSIIAAKESVKFNRWFYLRIYETIIVRHIKISDIFSVKGS